MAAPIPLLERDEELATIGRSLDGAVAGDGGLLTIEGEAGAGKTSLLDAAAGMAAERGMLVLGGRGGEYERDFPYGVVRQLFEPVLVDPKRRAELLDGTAAMAAPVFSPSTGAAGIGDPFGIQHGLYWLLVELAAAAPVALLIDDAQWADRGSLEAIAYSARRLEDLPIVIALTVRTGEPGAADGLFDQLRGEPIATRMTPPPLSAVAASSMIAAGTGTQPSARVADACQTATAGNPLLLVELLRGLQAEGTAPSDENAGRLAELAAAGLSDSILARLRRLGEGAVQAAEAVAVLEPNATPGRVAALAGMEPDAAAAACDRLISAQLLFDARPLGFVHPLVRSAVLGSISTPRRAIAHTRVARLLAEDGAEVDAVAAHLLHAEPQGDEWVVRTLRSAAPLALGRGAPGPAVGYLRRALREPPGNGQRTTVRQELGMALLRASDAEGLDVLREARAESTEPRQRAEIAVPLANSLSLRVGVAEGVQVLEGSLAETGDPLSPLGVQLRAHMLQMLLLGLERVPDDALPAPGEQLRPDSRESRLLMHQVALLYAIGFGSMSRARELACVSTADVEALKRDAAAGVPAQQAAIALALADQGGPSDTLCEIGIEAARRRGTAPGIPGNHGIRAQCRLLDGRLRDAEADAEIALRLLDRLQFGPTRIFHLGSAVRILVARGDLAVAEKHLVDPWPEPGPSPGLPGASLFCAMGELALARGRHTEARDHYLAAAERVRWLPFSNPEALPWQVGLAACEAALGDPDEAQRIAAEAVRLARETGGQRAIGITLCVQGTVAEGSEQVELLGEAVEALAETRAALHRARALIELGSALRRANRRKEARAPLLEGLDLAHRCGATPLEERARTELAAAGSRPRKAVLSGVESLTPSERRVADMAAEGMTNREIAQALFVTAKTVETHLRHVYQKLDICKRGELNAHLGPSAATSCSRDSISSFE
jgi:DNA-binding CsgD family transcriptional regulator